MVTPAVEKGETFVKPPFAQLSIRQIRRSGYLAEGQVKTASDHPVGPA
jgi:hypothetical protein